ncbi:MAG: type II toxin-antitoxin system PemK/MazF family toxin [Actinobacteria bacterium]|nr:type II toxin-antitoxin system PemK/MazF family toxin [Actinomycetota bacterium]
MRSNDPPGRGDVFYSPFDYTDLTPGKRRPVCVVSGNQFNASGPDVMVAMITSRPRLIRSPGIGDVVVSSWEEAGLVKPSVLRTGSVRTLETSRLEGRLGRLTKGDMELVDSALKEVLALS